MEVKYLEIKKRDKMIYTIGYSKNYRKAIQESDEGYIIKLGRSEGYSGGYAVKTYEDAQRLLKEEADETYEIFGLEADWERDTIPNPDSWWHYLLYDSKIIVLDL